MLFSFLTFCGLPTAALKDIGMAVVCGVRLGIIDYGGRGEKRTVSISSIPSGTCLTARHSDERPAGLPFLVQEQRFDHLPAEVHVNDDAGIAPLAL